LNSAVNQSHCILAAMQQIVILCPLYNDEDCFNIFAAQLFEEVKPLSNFQFSLLVINDGSLQKISLKSLLPIKIIHLHRNMGHQKALAIGLSYAYHNMAFDKIIVMDADGEDKPEDVSLLLHASNERDNLIVAHRSSRQNRKRFKGFYFIYKFLFRLLTGREISFGNFMVLNKNVVSRLVYTNEIWNHLAAAIIKSRIVYKKTQTHRGKRYTGGSKMNFSSLVLHGLGAIGVFIDTIATRLLIFSIIMIGISILSIFVIIAIKFFTSAAIPGWATTAFSSMLIVLLQSCLLSLFTIFLYLSSQSQRQFIPANHYKDYMASVEEL
jgi:polyisoprenyl-phosphate glycosyltransferase